MFAVQSGVAIRAGRILTEGSVFGYDFVLANEALHDRRFAVALTLVETLSLTRSCLDEVRMAFEPERKQVKRFVVRTSLRRALIRKINKGEGRNDEQFVERFG